MHDPLYHRFLTGGPWAPWGPVDGYSGVHGIAFLNDPKINLFKINSYYLINQDHWLK